MNYKELLHNSAVAFLAQAIGIVVSIITTLILPKQLGVTEFGYWQLFIFYASYAGFFHLGLSDGIYLIEGGKSRNVINKSRLHGQFVLLIAYEIFFSLIICVFALLLPIEEERAYVLLLFAYYIIVNNGCLFLGFIFQAMNETRLYSYSVMVDRMLFLIPMAVLLFLHDSSFEHYVIFYCLSKTISLAYCIWNARDFMGMKMEAVSSVLNDARHYIVVGIKVLIANTASMLIVGILRFSIDNHWGIQSFSRISFALSLINFVLFFMQQVSMVLFPALRQAQEKEIMKVYQATHLVLDALAPYVYLLYYPAVLILSLWLPSYQESLLYFGIFLPICIFDAKMEIGCATLFKVKRKENIWLSINLATVAVSGVFVVIGTYLLNSTVFASLGVVLAIIGRSLFSEIYIARSFTLPFQSSTVITLVVSVIFILAVLFVPIQLSAIGYLVLVCIWSIYLWRNRRKSISMFHSSNQSEV